MQALEVKIKSVEKRLDKYEKDQEKIKELVIEIHQDMSRYKGFVGGVLFVFSAVGTALALIFNYKVG